MQFQSVGVVLIGRNEGERLERAILAAKPQAAHLVYVDSGSTDGSIAMAQRHGCHVIQLDTRLPFNAARARNAGAEFLFQSVDISFIQFIDGDCELDPQWLQNSMAEMGREPKAAVVCGRRRERFPNQSIYNKLVDVEWDTPVGEADACGGDALMRRIPFEQVGGFDTAFAAGEEPELCYRMRRRGWTVHRIDAEMTLHDAAMTSAGQWWQRNVRSGSAYAQNAWVHGREPGRMWVRESASIWLWAAAIPLAIFGLSRPTKGWSLLGLFGYPLLASRIFGAMRKQGRDEQTSRRYALFTVLGKFPQLLGQIKFLTRRQSKLIEYK